MNAATQLGPSIHNTKSNRDNYFTPINVAIYCRISIEHEKQLSAFDNQMDWYSLLLSSHPNWNVVEIYSDKASGTNTKKRKDFNRMITDAMNHKFDLIVTREVCRFARNTISTLNDVILLSSNEIEVYFVNKGISSSSTDSELQLPIISTFVLDENRKISQRVRAEKACLPKKRCSTATKTFAIDI